MNISEKKRVKKLIRNLSQKKRRVLLATCDIPFGETRSYKWVALKSGIPCNAREVGRILSQNPFPFLIPCHRVIRSDGSRGGFMFGTKFKKQLLDLENSINSCIM